MSILPLSGAKVKDNILPLVNQPDTSVFIFLNDQPIALFCLYPSGFFPNHGIPGILYIDANFNQCIPYQVRSPEILFCP